MTTESEVAVEKRATGKTTRLVDRYVQPIFNNPNQMVGVPTDHNINNEDRLIYDKTWNRPQAEHPQNQFRKGGVGNNLWIAVIKLTPYKSSI